MSQFDMVGTEFENLHNEAVSCMQVSRESAKRAYSILVDIVNRELYRVGGFTDWREYAKQFCMEADIEGQIPTVIQKLRTHNRLGMWAGVDEDVLENLPPSVANAIESLASPHQGWERRENGKPSALMEWRDPYVREAVQAFLSEETDDNRTLIRDLTEHLASLSARDAISVVDELKHLPGTSIVHMGPLQVDPDTGDVTQWVECFLRNEDNETMWTWQRYIEYGPLPAEVIDDFASRLRVQIQGDAQ